MSIGFQSTADRLDPFHESIPGFDDDFDRRSYDWDSPFSASSSSFDDDYFSSSSFSAQDDSYAHTSAFDSPSALSSPSGIGSGFGNEPW